MQNVLTEQEYFAEVRSIVDALIAEARDDGDDADAFCERVWQTIDGHEWVIYTHRAQQVLVHSSNDGYAIEEWGADGVVSNGALDWSRLAFGALYADVQEELSRRDGFDPSDPCATNDDDDDDDDDDDPEAAGALKRCSRCGETRAGHSSTAMDHAFR